MPRMRIELTSARDDGAWTWRAAGARQPRGSIDRALLPEGVTVGDVLRVEVDQFMDGIEVTSVLHDQEERTAPETLEIIGSERSEPLVTTKLAGGRGRRDGDRSGGRRDGDRRGRRDGDGRAKRDGAARPVPLCTPVAVTLSPAVSVASPTGTVTIATTTPTGQLRRHQWLTAPGPDDLQGLGGGAFLLVV